MTKRHRLVFLIISLIVLIFVGRLIKGNWQFLLNDFWFTSGLLLLILLSLIDQPFFSKDSDVFLNAVTAGLSLLLVDTNDRNWIFWMFFSFVIYLIISSWLVMWLRLKPLNEENKWIQFFARFNREIGKPQTIYSAFFLWGAIKQFGYNSNGFNALFAFWLIFIIIDMPMITKLIEGILNNKANQNEINAIGKIFGVQSKNTFLVKLFPVDQRPSLRLFDFIEFRYSVEESNYVRRGMVFDIYWLNEEQWIKILTNKEIELLLKSIPKNNSKRLDAVYKIPDIKSTEYLKRFIGIIIENSTIDKVRFVYNSRVKIMEGQLLHVSINDEIVVYQILEGVTKIEQLENKNQFGYIIGEAIQLGTWNNKLRQFEKYGWVPAINTPVYTVIDISESEIEKGELILGYIPDTKYPIILNMETAITHHMAILGVTGTGKSVFSRNLVRQYIKNNEAKIIIVDFTGEYNKAFSDLNPSNIITTEEEQTVYNLFESVNLELEKFPNQQNKELIKKCNDEVSGMLNKALNSFISDKQRLISIIELPDVSNTQNILEYTKRLFKELFKIAKEKRNNFNKMCIVLEEAHTVVPEWNFSGESNKASQNVLNSIAQIALQGRKYNVGLLVIAQRTANVSKTILTQCNTVISFQEYDKTSIEFLSNYFGEEISAILPTLKFRRAIAAGKALKSNVPMIFEVPYINETIIDKPQN